MLIRRNTEGSHLFSETIDNNLNIFDMQGLLLDRNGHFTTAIEAFELTANSRLKSLSQEAFDGEEKLYVRASFAAQVGVPFYVLLHKEGEHIIHFFELYADADSHKCKCRNKFHLSEAQFIEWWHERKQTRQTKPYREQFLGRVRRSYFDSLLESNELKWGGNIDGYFVSSKETNYTVEGIIEKRFTTRRSITRYDPAYYFNYGGGDYKTWEPLFTLKNQLAVPLYLFTYSRCEGEERKVGVTVVTSLSQRGITYITDERNHVILPYSNICNNEAELKQRLQYLQTLL